MGSAAQGYGYFIEGKGPTYVEGVSLDIRHDDGSTEWDDLFQRALQEPVRED